MVARVFVSLDLVCLKAVKRVLHALQPLTRQVLVTAHVLIAPQITLDVEACLQECALSATVRQMTARRARNVLPTSLTRQPLETASVSIAHRITRAAEAPLLARAMLASARQTAVLLAVHVP